MSAALANDYYYGWLHGEHYDPVFDAAAAAMSARFKEIVDRVGGKLFLVDIGDIDLFDVYLASFPESQRQYHTCHTCKSFIRKFGRLAAVDAEGRLFSAMWIVNDAVPALYRPAFAAMKTAVEAGNIEGQFLSTQEEWGSHELGGWTHFAVYPPTSIIYRNRPGLKVNEAMAKARQDFGTLSHGLADYPREVVAQAVNLLKADSLQGAERCLAPAEFLLKLHDQLEGLRDQRRRKHLIWRAVANAPVGFCVPRSTMVGTLLDDIKAGKPVDVVARGFARKMSPLQYRRPQAAPTAGAIQQAEKLVAELGIATSLRRRLARIEDIEAIWTPKSIDENAPIAPSVFGMLLPKNRFPGSREIEAPAQPITFEKFRRTVLPEALKIEAFTGDGINGIGLVTAADPAAPPILQWDSAERRNPVSWYVYPNGVDDPRRWNLLARSWVELTALALQPSMWDGDDVHAHHGKSAILILKGARDTQPTGGSALFPQLLKSELNPVRSVIEAFSRRTQLEEAELTTACGIRVAGGGSGVQAQLVRVTTRLGKAQYRIDRWD